MPMTRAIIEIRVGWFTNGSFLRAELRKKGGSHISLQQPDDRYARLVPVPFCRTRMTFGLPPVNCGPGHLPSRRRSSLKRFAMKLRREGPLRIYFWLRRKTPARIAAMQDAFAFQFCSFRLMMPNRNAITTDARRTGEITEIKALGSESAVK